MTVLTTTCKTLGFELKSSLSTNFETIPQWKRSLDISAIILTSPLIILALVTVAVWSILFVKGPLFHEQERVGRGKKRFILYKFQTMSSTQDCNLHREHIKALVEKDLPLTKLDDISPGKFYPGARFIRALGLDEVPQILNVLRGEMSLVGPRPCLPYELPYFDKIPNHRFKLLPGITGKWQVSGKNRLRFREMIECDLDYARSLSLGVDLEIMMSTVRYLLRQGAEIAVKCRDRVH